MRLCVTLLFAFTVLSLQAQEDSCSNYTTDCQFCEITDTYYHDNGQLAFQRRQFLGRERSKTWDCNGNLIKKTTSYKRFVYRKGKSKHWQASYHTNGQVKEIKRFVVVGCLHFRRMRYKEFDEEGKRIR